MMFVLVFVGVHVGRSASKLLFGPFGDDAAEQRYGYSLQHLI